MHDPMNARTTALSPLSMRSFQGCRALLRAAALTILLILPATAQAQTPQTTLLIRGETAELSGTVAGATVAPTTNPSGLTGALAITGSGSVTFAPAQVGNGVFFESCCDNGNAAYYKFTGETVGSVFNVDQGQITFYLKSRSSFLQRQTNAAAPR